MVPPEHADALQPLVAEVLAAAPRGCKEVEDPLDDLIRGLRDQPPIEVCKQLLGGLRSHRCFDAMSRLADALMTAGAEYPYVRRQLAQALIERGQLNLAQRVLEELVESLPEAEKQERSEALGLLGRVHKQRFVTWSEDPQRAVPQLSAAIRWYRSAYPLDPAWHGANLVALTRRAERDGIPLEGDPSKAVAQAFLADLNKIPLESWTQWTWAAAGEAWLALEAWAAARSHYGEFARHPEIDGFAVASAVRQLREIWGIGAAGGGGPAEQILAALETRVLTAGRAGELSSSPGQLEQLSARLGEAGGVAREAFEAILGDDRTLSIEVINKLLSIAGSVCQVVDRGLRELGRKSGGTGFLVDGGALRAEWKGRALVVTNHHVLSENGAHPSVARARAEVIFHFYQGKKGSRTFEVESILEHSPIDALDFAVASLRPQPPIAAAVDRLSLDPLALGGPADELPARVFLIGHPDGRGIEFSMGGNTVIDHQLGDPDPIAGGYRRIHYRAPTEKGMSGSPVLDAMTLEVVGLHRQGGRVRPLRQVAKPDAYRANEAVWTKSIVDSLVGPGT